MEAHKIMKQTPSYSQFTGTTKSEKLVFLINIENKFRSFREHSNKTMVNQQSFLSFVQTDDADGDLLDYIKGFVYDNGGRCLKSEIIQAILLNLIGIGVNVKDGLQRNMTNKENTFGGTFSSFIFNNRFHRGGMSSINRSMIKLHEKFEEFEDGDFYVGTGLSFETSKMTGRKIYKYVEPVEHTESLIDLSSKFEIGVKVSDSNEFSNRTFSDISKPFVFGNPYLNRSDRRLFKKRSEIKKR